MAEEALASISISAEKLLFSKAASICACAGSSSTMSMRYNMLNKRSILIQP
jgi:hypothetical protein